jgi:2-succinyl-5-enolpyruvyl-6-hydroxy-3-cyclohexene-1-carboxylate synthase
MKEQIHKLVASCVNVGIKYAVISPGMRNAPLISAISQHDKIKVVSIIDEREAGFVALGIARQTKTPVIMLCTSGSAALGFMPAICEAYYSDTPLLVLTADRYKYDHFFNQTIYQKNMYQPYCKDNLELREDNEKEITKAIYNLTNKKLMHINIPLKDDILNSNLLFSYSSTIKLRPQKKRAIVQKTIVEFKEKIYKAKKILIICGFMAHSDKLKKILDGIEIPIIGDISSNLYNCNFFINSAKINWNKQGATIQPDFIISIGKNLLSTSIIGYFNKHKVKNHYHISEGLIGNPFGVVSKKIRLSAEGFLRIFKEKKIIYKKQQKYINLLQDNITSDNRFYNNSTYVILKKIIPLIDKKSHLHLANSLPIRVANLLINKKHNFKIHSMRGTAGIEGVLGSTVGSAISKPYSKHILIIGDISFFYSSNALWLNEFPKNLVIILINNYQGGIFDITASKIQHSKTKKLMQTPHKRLAVHICSDYNIPYHKIEQKDITTQKIDFSYGLYEFIV